MVEHVGDPAAWMTGYADGIQHVQDLLASGLEKDYDPARHVLLFAAHLHVTGARFSKSERHLHVTDSYATRVERIPQVSYAAYGHIHRPQALPGTVPGRYAGSPIPLDFGEEDESKELVVVDAEPGRPARVEPHKISGGRPLRRIEGTLEEIAQRQAEAAGSLCLVTVNTEKPIPNLADAVPELLPGAVLLSVTENCAAHRLTVLTREDARPEAAPSFAELFRDYLAEQGTRSSAADRVMAMFEKLIAAVEAEEEPSFSEVESLERAAREMSTPEAASAREGAAP
jgi:exonuclease SbcD